MSIIDTPGTGSSTDVFKHAVLIKAGLTALPVNRIFVTVEYHGRTTTMVRDYEEIIQPLKMKGYHEKVVILVTKFDLCKPRDQARRRKEVAEFFADSTKCVPPCNSLIFCDEDMEDDVLGEEMWSYCK